MLCHHLEIGCPRRTFTLATLSLCLVNCAVQCQEYDFLAESRAELVKQDFADYYKVNFEIGELPAGKSGLIKLEIVNPFDEEILFTDTRLACNCVKFETASNRIPAKSTLSVSIRLTTAKNEKSADAFAAISLTGQSEAGEKKPKLRVAMTIHYRLGGLLSFKGQLVTLEIPEGLDFGEIRVPFVFTAPVEFGNLELKHTESLRDLVFRIEEGGEPFHGIVVATASHQSVSMGPIGGQVSLIDKKAEREDGFFCTVQKSSPVKLAPNLLRFAPDVDEEEVYSAHAILVLGVESEAQPEAEEEIDDENQKQIKDENVTVSGSYDGVPLDINTKRLGNRTYRIRLFLRKDKADEFPDGISDILASLTVREGGRIHKLEKRVYFVSKS